MLPTKPCSCAELDDLALIGMGGDGLDEQVFATLDRVRDHGGAQWWLYLVTCSACGQSWMVAQEERVHDNYCLKRLDDAAAEDIMLRNRWPDDFLRFEQVLRREVQFGQTARFFDPRSPALVDTAVDLRRENPDISTTDIAYALAVSEEQVKKLLKRWTNPKSWF